MDTVVLTAAGIRVTCVPGRGGKLTSINDLDRDREWLVPPGGPLDGPVPPGLPFTDGDMCGWDEMVPTIIPCRYPGPGQPDLQLPDHGELWTLPWPVTQRDDRSLTLAVVGRVLPYRLERQATVTPSSLLLDYRLDAAGDEPLQLLWAAHPQFRCRSGTRIVMPAHVRAALDVTDPRRPQRIAWPGQGTDQVDKLPRGTGRKLVLDPGTQASWVSLVDPDGTALRLSWDCAQVPYLGLWLDHLRFSPTPCVVLEPTTGFYDDLALASASGRVMSLRPGQPIRWSLRVSLGTRSAAGPPAGS